MVSEWARRDLFISAVKRDSQRSTCLPSEKVFVHEQAATGEARGARMLHCQTGNLQTSVDFISVKSILGE